MPRAVAWLLRLVVIVPLLFLIGYVLVAPQDGPVRFGYRLFIPAGGMLLVMVWQLTKVRDSESIDPPSADKADT